MFRVLANSKRRVASPAPDGGYPGQNTAEGQQALKNLDYTPTSGNARNNTAVGFEAMFASSTGSSNTGIGAGAVDSNTTGNQNTAVGTGALHGIPGQGTASYNTAIGQAALFSNNASYNTASGYAALANNYAGSYNAATGVQALFSNTSGYNNTASGITTLYSNTIGVDNSGSGRSALSNNTTGSDNTAEGFNALSGNTQAHSTSPCLGANAGRNLTTGNKNIDIGNQGIVGESSTMRIGKTGTQTKMFIAGISGKTVANGVGVFINANGQLGTIQSSARYKEAVKPMDKASEAILELKPVTFRYKEEIDPAGVPQFGLIGEEIEKVNPDLVGRDENSKVNTARYEAVNAMLLNEFPKEHRGSEEQRKQFESRLAGQQKQIEALTATLQKVSERIEVSKPTTQLVANDR